MQCFQIHAYLMSGPAQGSKDHVKKSGHAGSVSAHVQRQSCQPWTLSGFFGALSKCGMAAQG